MLNVTISTKVITWLCNELDCEALWAEEFAQNFISFLQASGSISTTAPDAGSGGYQPTHGDLDPSNPPRGGSGVPSGIPTAAPQKPDWWPKTPYPASIFPMARERYPEIVPDPQLRTALSGMLGREFWDIASEMIWEAMREAVEDGRLIIIADRGCAATEYCIDYDRKGPDACDECPIGPPPKEAKL